MDTNLLSEKAIRRAYSDTVSAQKTARFMWGGEAVLATGGGAWLVAIAPEGISDFEQIVRAIIGGLIGLVAALLLILIWNLFRAPYRQRNEARNMVRQLSVPSDNEVIDSILLFQTESLVTKHNNGKERSYSFTKVFLAIADQLSVGIPLNRFEEKIRKGLGIDEREGWYFPYEDEGITHLIGMLVQNALVERHNEEDQHMTRELVSGVAGLYLTPDAHLVKNTEVKYYLSPLGATVVQQLCLQSPVHNKIAKIVQELRTFNAIGNKKLDVATILYEMREKLAVGLYELDVAIELSPVFAELRIRGILDLVKRQRYLGTEPYEAMCWELDSLGKEVILYLERVKQQASHKEGSQIE